MKKERNEGGRRIEKRQLDGVTGHSLSTSYKLQFCQSKGEYDSFQHCGCYRKTLKSGVLLMEVVLLNYFLLGQKMLANQNPRISRKGAGSTQNVF